jgi:hypothetical protein
MKYLYTMEEDCCPLATGYCHCMTTKIFIKIFYFLKTFWKMKKLTEEEAKKLHTRPASYRSGIRYALITLKPGEYLQLDNQDWKWKSHTPSTYCRRLERHSTLKYDCKRLIDGSGWLIKRLK